MARVPNVRRWLLEQLRGAARGNDLVTDGRDMGTVVFPAAELKVFLTAQLSTRARRRLQQQGHRAPGDTEIAAEVERLAQRDRIDSERAHAPLRRADDAVDIDTTALGFDEQVTRIVELARERRPAS
jgi:cytidylate kinase